MRWISMGIAAAVFAATGCLTARGESAAQFGKLSLDEVSGLLGKPGVVIYDDNSEDVYRAGHIPGAKHLGVSEVSAGALPPDKSTELVFYCANPH